jgi:hypothetical protein
VLGEWRRVYLGEGVHGFLEEADLKLAHAYAAAQFAAMAYMAC